MGRLAYDSTVDILPPACTTGSALGSGSLTARGIARNGSGDDV